MKNENNIGILHLFKKDNFFISLCLKLLKVQINFQNTVDTNTMRTTSEFNFRYLFKHLSNKYHFLF